MKLENELSEIERRRIKRLHRRGMSIRTLSSVFEVQREIIQQIVRRGKHQDVRTLQETS